MKMAKKSLLWTLALALPLLCSFKMTVAQELRELCAIDQFDKQFLGGGVSLNEFLTDMEASFGGVTKCSSRLAINDGLGSLFSRLESASRVLGDFGITRCARAVSESLATLDGLSFSYTVSSSKEIKILEAPQILGADGSNAYILSGNLVKDAKYFKKLSEMDDQQLKNMLEQCADFIASNPSPELLTNDDLAAFMKDPNGEIPKVRTQGRVQITDEALNENLADALRQKLAGCWSVPSGAREADITVKVRFSLNPDGTLAGLPEVLNSGADPLFDKTAQSAVSAILECQSYDFFPPDRYDLWKDNTVTFNPNMMSGS